MGKGEVLYEVEFAWFASFVNYGEGGCLDWANESLGGLLIEGTNVPPLCNFFKYDFVKYSGIIHDR